VELAGLSRKIPQGEVAKFAAANVEVQKWLRKISSDYTKNYYSRALVRYCEAVAKSPRQLLELKKMSKDHDAEDLLDDFIDQAKRANAKNSVLWNISKAVKSFYKWNYFDLARAAGNIDVQQVRAYRVPDKNGILRYLEGLNMRDRALVVLASSTGIAEGSIPLLKWRHIEGLDSEVPHIALTGDMVKGHNSGRYAGLEQHTFLTPHAKRTLLDYRAWRERKDKTVLGPDDYVFVTVEEPIGPLSLSAIRNMMDRHSEAIGLKYSYHDFRRFVETALERAGLHPNLVKKILRHKVKGQEAAYSQPKIEELRAAYKQAIPLLDLGVSEQPEIEKTVKQLTEQTQAENRELRGKVEVLEDLVRTMYAQVIELTGQKIGLTDQEIKAAIKHSIPEPQHK